ncbi:MAG: CHASE2 domain-containing protein, partial [Burkholderiaceae bacterium]|nr:CHASE2 domain-containing protein [Burkholderiaceae bacterium]
MSRIRNWLEGLTAFFRVRKELAGLYAAGLCLTLLVTLLSIFPTPTVQRAELGLYDLMVSGRSQAPQSQIPVVVGIDEDSLTAYGQWPWPRYRLALLIEQLQKLGAQVVALDFLMPELDRTAPEVIQRERQRDQITAGSTNAPVTAPAPLTPVHDGNSQRLAEALAHGPTVLGYYLNFAESSTQDPTLHSPKIPEGMVVSRSSHGTEYWPQP